ncbi:MAG TPA: FtsX-like permease family protein [Planctomycetes bacterium]|nr:FtsX-like permease family protein [Planctomycetota bacterium]
MILSELVQEALRSLWRHKLRSLLTALGIICGIASVTAIVSTGEGAREALLAQIGELGIRNIIINAKKPPSEEKVSEKSPGSGVLEYGLTFRDREQMRLTLPFIEKVLGVHDVKEKIWFKSRRLDAHVRGVTPAYFETFHFKPILGRTLENVDEEHQRRVCVVREGLIREARYLGDPLKLDVKIGNDFYRVVGVLPEASFRSTNQTVLGIDDRSLEVYVPFRTVVDRFGLTQRVSEEGQSENTRVELHQIVCQVADVDQVLVAARCIRTLLNRLHPRKDFEMTVPLELLESKRKTQQIFSLVLPVFAGITLLVGGIGILNIMLASVTERTREIGIRRAIGATRFDITLQFLVETVVLSLLGGSLGVGAGAGFTSALHHFAGMETRLTPWAVGLSLVISTLTGLVFGIYPARRAAQLDPIEALRR